MPKGPRKFHFSFEKTGLTRFGGLSLFQSFCRSLRLRPFLQLYGRWPDYHHRGNHPADLFLAHLFGIVAGIVRVEKTQLLIRNGLIPPILGFDDFPHRDTLRTFLWRFSSKDLQNLQAAHDRLRHELLLREFKGSYAMAKIPTRSFWANVTYMEMLLWAYDLVLAFQFLCLLKEVQHWNVSTLRRELWWLPAEWVRRNNRNLLVLPARYPRQALLLKIQHATEKVIPII